MIGYIGGLGRLQHMEREDGHGSSFEESPFCARLDVEPEVAHALPVLLDNLAALVARIGGVVGVATETKEAVVPGFLRLGAGAAP